MDRCGHVAMMKKLFAMSQAHEDLKGSESSDPLLLLLFTHVKMSRQQQQQATLDVCVGMLAMRCVCDIQWGG